MAVDLIAGKFIVRGYQHEYLPGQFSQVWDENYSKVQERYVSLDMNAIAVVHKPQEDTERPGADLRVFRFAAWDAQWDASSFADSQLYAHLKVLYESDLPFWVQFDDHMSRNFATLYPISADRKTWATPTWPIAPFGTTPVAPTTHYGNLFVNGFVITDGVTIDDESGIVYFDSAPDEDAEIYFRYTWKAYVRISQFDFAALEDGGADNVYVGRAIFEMVEPNTADDPWPVTVNSWSAEYGDPYPDTGVDSQRETCTAPFAPASLSSVARAGSTDAFANPTNARYVDSSYATALALSAGDKTEYLRPLFTPPIDIPADATLTRARLGFKGYVDPVSGLSIDIIDDSVFLTDNGVQVGSNKALNQPVPRADAWRWYDWDLTTLGLTVADLESGTLGADIGFIADPASYNGADWAISYEYEGANYTSRPGSSVQTEWVDSSDLDVTVDQTDQADGYVIAQQDGVIRVKATYIGGGSAPNNVFLSIYSKARAYTDDPDEITALVDNGQDDAGVFGVGNDATSEGTHTYKVPVVAGVATKSLTLFAQASRSFAFSETDDPQARALLEVTGSVMAPPASNLYIGAVTLNLCWQSEYTPPEESGDESYTPPTIAKSTLQWSRTADGGWQEGYGDGTCGCFQVIEGNGARFVDPDSFGAGEVKHTTGDFWLGGSYEEQNWDDMAVTLLVADVSEGDNTTDESSPEGAATSGEKALTVIKAFRDPVWIDTAKVVAGCVDSVSVKFAYSDDMVTWTDFTGIMGALPSGTGTYAPTSIISQGTTRVQAKFVRCSVKDSVLSYGEQKAGVFDFRVYDGATLRTPP